MDTLPPELHSRIFELASESPFGGATIRAISLTCTYFRAVSSPFRFHTLTISSEVQSRHLTTLLDNSTRPEQHIRRLFISPATESAAPPSVKALLRLLYLAAPTLRDLVAILPSSACALIGAIFRIRFPQLKTLTVRGFYPLPRPSTFPALTHLHLAGNRSPTGLAAALALACPKITDLCVSGLRSAPAFVRELQDALGREERDDSDATIGDSEALGRFPTHLEHVCMEVQTLPFPNASKDLIFRDVQMRRMLAALEETVGKRRGMPQLEVKFLERDTNEDYHDAHKLKVSWLGMACP
ncbi:hypothetical protein R3P38DRAFT_2951170 [Favolaschia claudopus]|uniref:F-box domain-containing protein n=1 Tax=Favolaschia claudopus TaxID=2862362 RepID=A0AAW0BEB5_9AGAR